MIAQSFLDLADDFVELHAILSSTLRRLSTLEQQTSHHIRPSSQAAITSIATPVITTLHDLLLELDPLQTPSADQTIDRLKTLIATKQRITDIARSIQGVAGSLLTAADWQSPSFLNAGQPQAGKETGRIEGGMTDYHRESHGDAGVYESQFRSAYIDAPLRIPPQVCATANGMAAFSTVASFLALEVQITGPILVGKSSYFENKSQLQKFFNGRIIWVDEMDTNAIIASIKANSPGAIFLDTICNAITIAAPDLATLIPRIGKVITRPTVLVLDTTGTATSYQPFKDLAYPSRNLNLIVVESLVKYHQFGFDRVSAGVMWRSGLSAFGLMQSRAYMGTNIADASVLALPQPNRKLLDKRLQRLNRNATYLAQRLDDESRTPSSTISAVIYPGLPSHPSYSWMKDRSFQGSFFAIEFKPPYTLMPYKKAWLNLAIKEAQRAEVNLIAGSSFGFNTTRIYLTAMHARKNAVPFIRISAGTETLAEIEALAKVFIETSTKLTRRLPW